MVTQPENWETVKNLFEAALELSQGQRSEFLLQNCADSGMREKVLVLISEYERTDSVLSMRGVGNGFSDRFRDAPRKFSAGDLLADRFRIVRFIAAGGMGEVYEAKDLELGEDVAVKTVRPDLIQEPKVIARFKREVQLARRVTHPNVCRTFDLFRHEPVGADGVIFVSMELLRGPTLAERLTVQKQMSQEEAFPLVRQMSAGLSAAHEIGIVHRDFKPGNVVLVEGGSLKEAVRAVVTDFGLAAPSTAIEGLSLSNAGQLFGTPAYMSPEQIEGHRAAASSDIYALGLVIYEMVTGVRPFQGDTPISTALKRLSELPLPPRKLQPELSPSWESTILRCLERDPKKRFASAAEIAGTLEVGRTSMVLAREAFAGKPPGNEISEVSRTQPPSTTQFPLESRSLKKKLIFGIAITTSLIIATVLLIAFRFRGLTPNNSLSTSRRLVTVSSVSIEKNGAIDPQDEGFKVHAIGGFDSNVVRNLTNQGMDRWRVVSNDQGYYYRPLSDAEKDFALSKDWKLTCVCALEKGGAFADIDFGRGKGAHRFDIGFLQEGNKFFVALTKQISPQLEWEKEIEFPGVADVDHPHTYQLRYDHLAKTASLWIDGRLMASGYHGHDQFREGRGLLFGSVTYGSSVVGIGVFRSVRFEAY